MARPATQNGLNKFKRYRVGCKADGMKPVWVWTIDPRAPGFSEEERRQALLLRGAREELEALDFIEAAADLDGW